MKKNITLISLLPAIILSLTGCSPTTERSSIPTQTIHFTETSEATETLAPTPTVQALSSDGPWMIYGCEESGLSISGISPDASVRFTNPEFNQEGWLWSLYPSPATPYILGYYHPQWSTAISLAGEEIEKLQIALFRLPEMSIEWSYQIIAPEAIDQLQAAISRSAPEPEDSPVKVNATNVYFFASPDFSPDGQYITFSSVVNGSDFDLFIYDIQNKTLKVLANSIENEIGSYWAPDSQALLYSIPYPEGIIPSADFWSISVDGQSQYQLLVNAGIDAPAWVSNTQVLIQNSGADFSPSNLRLLDTASGEIIQLYPGVFADAAYDPATQTTFLNLSRDKSWQPDVPEGMYRLTPSHSEPELVSEGIYTQLEWQPEWGRFMARRVDEQNQTIGMEFFSPEGEALTIPNPDWYLNSDPLTSPDGRYALVKDANGWQLYQSSGEIVREIGQGKIIWLPDSSGFLRLEMIDETSHTGIIFLHSIQNNWAPKVITSNSPLCTEDFSILE